jgi:hypothetical protein
VHGEKYFIRLRTCLLSVGAVWEQHSSAAARTRERAHMTARAGAVPARVLARSAARAQDRLAHATAQNKRYRSDLRQHTHRAPMESYAQTQTQTRPVCACTQIKTPGGPSSTCNVAPATSTCVALRQPKRVARGAGRCCRSPGWPPPTSPPSWSVKGDAVRGG